MQSATPNSKKVEERGGIKGLVTLTNFVIQGARAMEIDNFLRNATEIAPELYAKLIAELHELCEVRQVQYQNLVVTSGRSIFARLLLADTTYTGAINYGALGTGATAAAAGDTTLGTEVFRKIYATRTRSGAQATVDFYYSKGDTNGTYTEFGCFIDGTASTDSGQLFNRVLTGGWTKSSIEAMTVTVQIDVNAG